MMASIKDPCLPPGGAGSADPSYPATPPSTLEGLNHPNTSIV
jgi:hypothetical protein